MEVRIVDKHLSLHVLLVQHPVRARVLQSRAASQFHQVVKFVNVLQLALITQGFHSAIPPGQQRNHTSAMGCKTKKMESCKCAGNKRCVSTASVTKSKLVRLHNSPTRPLCCTIPVELKGHGSHENPKKAIGQRAGRKQRVESSFPEPRCKLVQCEIETPMLGGKVEKLDKRKMNQ